jgi:Ulp1 family protease
MEELKEPGSQPVNNPRREDEENGDIIDIDSGRPEVMRNIVIVKEFEIKKQEFSIDRRRNSMIQQEKSLKEDDDRIKMVLSFSGIGATVFKSIGGDSISFDSLKTLNGQNWINDEVISFFMRLLKIRDTNRCSMDRLRKPIHFFKSFFFNRIVNISGKYVYKDVHKWGKKQIKDIFSLGKLMIPVNVDGNHWVLICVHFQSKRICYLDSLNRDGLHLLKLMRQYLKDEWRNGIHNTEGEFPWNDWNLETSSTSSNPQQMNGYDCGVFTCMFADKLSNDEDMSFNQEDVTKFRKAMLLDILDGEVEQTNMGFGFRVLDEMEGILGDSRDVSNEEGTLILYG